MNRIILIGNGFDLAHKIPTSYVDFINDYWKKVIREIKQKPPYSTYNNDDVEIENTPGNNFSGTTYSELISVLKRSKSIITINNKFLEIITKKSSLENWVDIENEYYNLLLSSFKSKSKSEEYNIEDLNKDFEALKNRLKEYLEVEIDKFNDNYKDSILKKPFCRIEDVIYKPIQPRDLSEYSFNETANIEFQSIKKIFDQDNELASKGISINRKLDEKKERLIKQLKGVNNKLNEVKALLRKENASKFFDLIPKETLLLNFNYTEIDRLYSDYISNEEGDDDIKTDISRISIHGTINDLDDNPIIFGFGDELDENYQSIEKLNNNKYFENIKSIKYLETDNYKTLLEYMNSDLYQVLILGHSCGTSDRTMLNTMFEHDNCASIKVYYHQVSENNDNYSDVVRNISRNFNDKAKYRDRVVNKKYCDCLLPLNLQV